MQTNGGKRERKAQPRGEQPIVGPLHGVLPMA